MIEVPLVKDSNRIVSLGQASSTVYLKDKSPDESLFLTRFKTDKSSLVTKILSNLAPGSLQAKSTVFVPNYNSKVTGVAKSPDVQFPT